MRQTSNGVLQKLAMQCCRMEQGEVKDWADVEKIDKIWWAHAQKHVGQKMGSNPK